MAGLLFSNRNIVVMVTQMSSLWPARPLASGSRMPGSMRRIAFTSCSKGFLSLLKRQKKGKKAQALVPDCYSPRSCESPLGNSLPNAPAHHSILHGYLDCGRRLNVSHGLPRVDVCKSCARLMDAPRNPELSTYSCSLLPRLARIY